MRTQKLGESTMLSQKDIEREIKRTELMISQCEQEISAIKGNPKAPSPQIPRMAAQQQIHLQPSPQAQLLLSPQLTAQQIQLHGQSSHQQELSHGQLQASSRQLSQSQMQSASQQFLQSQEQLLPPRLSQQQGQLSSPHQLLRSHTYQTSLPQLMQQQEQLQLPRQVIHQEQLQPPQQQLQQQEQLQLRRQSVRQEQLEPPQQLLSHTPCNDFASQKLNPLAKEFMTRDIGYHPDRVPMYSSTPYNREPRHPLNTQDELTVILSQLVSLLSKRSHLPPMEPEIFTGDILTFPAWLRSFEFLIEAHTSSEEEKLFYMGKYTGGEAKNMIRGFLTLSGPGIFTKAKMALKQRYGERYHIAAAFKKELSGWPVIKPGDGPALRHFSDFLNQCNSAMRTTKYLECLNHADENQKLSQKLPRNLQDRWNRTVDRWLYGSDAERETYGETFEGSFPPFAEFCKFISNEARIACGPGLIGISESTSKSSDKYREKTSFATSLAVETEGPQSEKEKKKLEAD